MVWLKAYMDECRLERLPRSPTHKRARRVSAFALLGGVVAIASQSLQASWVAKPSFGRSSTASQRGVASGIRGSLRPSARSAEGKREAWDLIRAARTAAYFGALPNPLSIFGGGDSKGSTGVQPGDVLWSDSNPRKLQWGSLDDVVMGGASRSSIVGNTWRGTVIEEGGGFAGIRIRALEPALDVSSCSGLRVKVTGGDGQRFKLIIRDDYDWNGIAWSYTFDTLPGADVEVMAAFKDFVPTKFARSVSNEKFNTAQLTALQFTLSKFEYDGELNPSFKPGDFSLKLKSIEMY